MVHESLEGKGEGVHGAPSEPGQPDVRDNSCMRYRWKASAAHGRELRT